MRLKGFTMPYANKQKKGQKQMCTVSINIDEATIQQINPRLTSHESIGCWLQHQVDLMLEEMTRGMTIDEFYANMEQNVISDDEETMGIEEARAMVHAAIREEYAKP